MVRNFLLFLFLELISSSLFLFAQTPEVMAKGRIYDAKTLEGLPFVNVSVTGTSRGTVSSMSGVFSLLVKKGETVQVSSVGYIAQEFSYADIGIDSVLVELKSTEFQLSELNVKPGVNPAYAILDSIVKHKETNDLQNNPFWSRKIYSKLEIDLKNIKRSEKDRKWLKQFEFIFDYVDTLKDSNETFLPVFFTENVSLVKHQKGRGDAERIIATNTSGIKHPMVAEFTSSLYLDLDVYDNYYTISNVAFVSPVNNQGHLFYRYYLRDSMETKTGKQYLISYKPRKPEDRVFVGTFWVDKATWALTNIEMSLSPQANVNFMSKLSVFQTYKLDSGTWLPNNDSVYAEINLQKNSDAKTIGLIGRKSTWYTNYNFDEQEGDKKLKYGQVMVLPEAYAVDETYWADNRPEPLEKYEMAIFNMSDSISEIPLFKSVTEYLRIFFVGYKKVGPIEFGPYYYMYSRNEIEGHRFRLGARSTTDLFNDLRLNGYLAYGLGDNAFKYGGGADYFIRKEPLLAVGAKYMYDYQLLGKSDNAFMEDNILTSLLSRQTMSKLNLMQQASIRFRADITPWLNVELSAKTEEISASEYVPLVISSGVEIPDIKSNSVKSSVTIAPGQGIVLDTYESLRFPGRFPVTVINAEYGQVNFGDADVNYQRLLVNISDKLPVNPLGYMRLYMQVGKVWGDVPFPYLKIHEGNETYAFDPFAFNLMNYQEYISDEYIGMSIEHHLMGFFLNRIPLLAKLQWREVIGASAIYGTMNASHKNAMLSSSMSALPNEGYAEWHVGVENIFRILRLNATWRLTNPEEENDFAVQAVFQFTF